jgi:hypothetical protein
MKSAFTEFTVENAALSCLAPLGLAILHGRYIDPSSKRGCEEMTVRECGRQWRPDTSKVRCYFNSLSLAACS